MSALDSLSALIRRNDALELLYEMQLADAGGVLTLCPNWHTDLRRVWDVLDSERGDGDYDGSVIGRGTTPEEAIEEAARTLKFQREGAENNGDT